MAKKKEKIWTEDELRLTFDLIKCEELPLLAEWLDTEKLNFLPFEQDFFEKFLKISKKGADSWNEETLKMRFISPLLSVLVQFEDDKCRYETFFDKEISATVEGIYLQTETDFMIAKGLGDIAQTPYFHFQEYKRSRKSPPEPMAQLLEAFLIAQEKNKNGKPLYGLSIVGRIWQFVVMEGKQYGVSKAYDGTNREDLLKIIAVLRKFKVILETKLLD
jgi:hypothetical protein